MSQGIFRSVCGVILSLSFALPVLQAQERGAEIVRYFSGKEGALKIDMPGSQKGIDLREDKSPPMNWKDYGSRLKRYGTAIPKGSTARVTAIVVKNDRIEVQLDGGGFGTFLDDSATTVNARSVDKSNYEKDLERRISNASSDDERRRLQRDLDRERGRRERQEADNRNAAMVASQIKEQQVASDRVRGGSRFNLRWSGAIPSEQLTPEWVTHALADYIDFSLPNQPPLQPADDNSAQSPAGAPTAQLKRGMSMNDVAALLGQGQPISESVSADGMKTQVLDYTTGERHVQVTYVEGVVIRYTISSR